MTSQYRCETCKNVSCELFPGSTSTINDDTGYVYSHYHWYYSIIDKKGCASHSDFPTTNTSIKSTKLVVSQGLDKYIGWLQAMAELANDDANRQENYVEAASCAGRCAGFIRAKEKLEELRKGGE